ncbi:DUF6270 domain-containing protein [Niallia sp.]|uniref:DUF6270 domain-containing protein n=1 Tax=Niallia sp. TaxID=2837523 RepID=UPI002899CE85|nr:DUF6270 domain-containing protein [Niallia sp.]
MVKIKVSIIGSCVTREAFTTVNNPDYKETYEVGQTAFQTAITSFSSNPVPEGLIDISPDFTAYKKGVFTTDLYKTTRAELIEYQPDFLVVDFYADVRYGLAKIGDSIITNNPNTFRRSNYFKNNIKSADLYHVASRYTEFFKIFDRNFESLIEWMAVELPQTKLVVNCFRYSAHYRENGVDKYFVKYRENTENDNVYKRILRENDVFDKLYKHVVDKYGVLTIDNRDKVYYADGDHPYGVSPWHFGKPYFKDFMSTFHTIALKTKVVEPKLEEAQLVLQ